MAGGTPGFGGAGPKEGPGGCSSAQERAGCSLPGPCAGKGCSSAHRDLAAHSLVPKQAEALTNSAGLLHSCSSVHFVSCKSAIPWAFPSIPFTA